MGRTTNLVKNSINLDLPCLTNCCLDAVSVQMLRVISVFDLRKTKIVHESSRSYDDLNMSEK